jgi:hypothetical protein
MSGLAEIQSGIRDLLKKRRTTRPDDPYLRLVAESKGLAAIQGIALWWKAFQLESYCWCTGRLLKRLGMFEEAAQRFYFENAVSPFIEAAGDEFLRLLASHENPLITEVAEFERAVLRVKQGDPGEYCVTWDRNPEEVFRWLFHSGEFPAAESGIIYRMKISGSVANLVCCFREPVSAAPAIV